MCVFQGFPFPKSGEDSVFEQPYSLFLDADIQGCPVTLQEKDILSGRMTFQDGIEGKGIPLLVKPEDTPDGADIHVGCRSFVETVRPRNREPLEDSAGPVQDG